LTIKAKDRYSVIKNTTFKVKTYDMILLVST